MSEPYQCGIEYKAATMMISTLDICICTYKRNSLIHTLESISTLSPVKGLSLRVIVADNDEIPSASAVISTFFSKKNLLITYVHAPARNISIARNACLKASTSDWIAFIDDDEIVSSEWLLSMTQCINSERFDAIFGPVKAIYRSAAPEWLKSENYHSTDIVRVKGRIETGYTCNVIFNKKSLCFLGAEFDLKLGQSGGEDTDFFYRAFRSGGVFGYSENAVVFEPVSAERENLKWLCLRRFRSGQTFAICSKGRNYFWSAFLSIPKLLICVLMAALSIYRPKRFRYWLLRGALHFGSLMASVGFKNLTIYKDV